MNWFQDFSEVGETFSIFQMIGHFVVLLSGFSGLLDIISGNPRQSVPSLPPNNLVPLLQTAKYWTETFASEKKSSNDEKAYLEGGKEKCS